MSTPRETRLLLFADLLGFKALVRSLPLNELVARYHRVFDSLWSAGFKFSIRQGRRPEATATLAARESPPADTLAAFRQDTGISAFVMSDSMVLYSDIVTPSSPEMHEQLTNMMILGRTLMFKLFDAILPARAAIAYGEFHAEPEAGIYVGPALVDAYELSESQDWIGLSVADALSEEIHTLISGFDFSKYITYGGRPLRPNWDVLRYPVPFKTGPRDVWTVNWVTAWNVFGDPVPENFFANVLTGQPSIDRKYENTLKFMHHARSLCFKAQSL